MSFGSWPDDPEVHINLSRKNEGKITTILSYTGRYVSKTIERSVLKTRIRYRCGLCKTSIGKPKRTNNGEVETLSIVCPKCGAINNEGVFFNEKKAERQANE